MSDIKISQIDKKLFFRNKKNNKSVDKKPTKTNKKADNKKAICTIAAAIGVAALAGVIVHKVIKGKSVKSEVDKAAQEVKSVAKKLTNPDNSSEIKNIANKKGVQLSENKPFSGTLEAITKSGKKTKIVYENGYITKSYINGKLFKEYKENMVFDHTLDKFVPVSRDKGVKIFTYNEEGQKISENVQTFYDNGRIKHLWKSDKKGICVKDFFENLEGKRAIKAEAKYKSDKLIEDIKVYDKKGNLKLEGKDVGPNWKEIHYDNGRKIKEKAGEKQPVFDSKNQDISKYKLKDYKYIKYFDENGKVCKTFQKEKSPCVSKLDYVIEGKNHKNYFIENPTVAYAKELYENPDPHSPLSISLHTDDSIRFINTKRDGQIEQIPKHKVSQFTKEELKELVVRLREMSDIGSNENFQLNFDYLTKQIKAIEEYLQKTYPNA